jgi:hypothetical protein
MATNHGTPTKRPALFTQELEIMAANRRILRFQLTLLKDPKENRQ